MSGRGAAAVVVASLLAAAPPAPAQVTAGALRDRVVPVRGIDPADDDFTDLEPLVDAIGDARIVQLGEPSHGAGAAFAAKVRLIRFLHERMGFDVLVWESGMYDCRVADRALRAGVDPVEAARRGVFGIWSGVREVEPLFRYVQASKDGPRPLVMAGYDMQFSGSEERFPAELTEFLSAIPEVTLRDRALGLAERAAGGFAALRPARGEELSDDADYRRMLEASERLVALIDAQRAVLENVHAPSEVEFMRRAVENMALEGTSRYERAAPGSADAPEEATLESMNRGWNRRDTRNAEIMRWLADDLYAGRKLIVWAHNGHVMNAWYTRDWSALSIEPQAGGMKPVGAFLAEQRDDVYTIGIVAYGGQTRRMGSSETRTLPVPPDGSLEAALHAIGEQHLFLDLRGLPPDHPFRAPATMAIREYLYEQIPDWTRVIDGVFFNDVETPSTPLDR